MFVIIYLFVTKLLVTSQPTEINSMVSNFIYSMNHNTERIFTVQAVQGFSFCMLCTLFI